MRQPPVGQELIEHADIIAGLELARGDERLAGDLVERIIGLGEPIGRIDIDQDQAGFGGGELGDHPFGIIGRPDAAPFAGFEPQRQKAGGEVIDLPLQLGIGPAHLLMAHDERVAVRPAPGRHVEEGAHGLADQRGVADPVHIALCQPGHRSSHKVTK